VKSIPGGTLELLHASQGSRPALPRPSTIAAGRRGPGASDFARGGSGAGGFARGLAAVVAAIALGAAPDASAAEGRVQIEKVGVRRGDVTAQVRLVDAFDGATRSSIARGLPITARFTVEIWRKRSRWFDKQIDSRVSSVRIRYDTGERVFEVTQLGRFPRRETFPSLDQAVDEVSLRLLDVHPRWDLDERATYFVAVEAAIRPLTLEEFKELDDWIRGSIQGEGAPTDSTELPDDSSGGFSRAFFDFVVNLSGFGDSIYETRTPGFRPSELPPLDAGS
jgi:hypothetical protein